MALVAGAAGAAGAQAPVGQPPVAQPATSQALTAPAAETARPGAARPAPPRPIRQFDLRTTERLGREIARQDRAAWLASDALAPKLADAKSAGLLGWIVPAATAGGGPDLVRFLRGDEAAPEAAYDVRVPASGAPEVTEPADRKLSAEELAMWAARRTALAHMGPVCRPGYNVAAARDPNGRDWLVWLLAPMPAKGVIPLGGHYRFTVSPDGATLKARDALFATCVVVDPRQGVPAGATPFAVTASHVVSGAPVETHVFLQLQAKMPMILATPSSLKVWIIDEGRIRESR